MRFQRTATFRLLALLCVCLLGATAAQARSPKTKTQKPRTRTASKSTKASKVSSKHSRGKTLRRAHKPRGQQKIDSERARQIQAALIREHYLDGAPNGDWDQRTQEAMTRYQADHGWQTKALPDSRALIALGLGPSQNNLLNPQTAALPQAVSSGGASPAMSGASDFVQSSQHR